MEPILRQVKVGLRGLGRSIRLICVEHLELTRPPHYREVIEARIGTYPPGSVSAYLQTDMTTAHNRPVSPCLSWSSAYLPFTMILYLAYRRSSHSCSQPIGKRRLTNCWSNLLTRIQNESDGP